MISYSNGIESVCQNSYFINGCIALVAIHNYLRDLTLANVGGSLRFERIVSIRRHRNPTPKRLFLLIVVEWNRYFCHLSERCPGSPFIGPFFYG